MRIAEFDFPSVIEFENMHGAGVSYEILGLPDISLSILDTLHLIDLTSRPVKEMVVVKEKAEEMNWGGTSVVANDEEYEFNIGIKEPEVNDEYVSGLEELVSPTEKEDVIGLDAESNHDVDVNATDGEPDVSSENSIIKRNIQLYKWQLGMQIFKVIKTWKC